LISITASLFEVGSTALPVRAIRTKHESEVTYDVGEARDGIFSSPDVQKKAPERGNGTRACAGQRIKGGRGKKESSTLEDESYKLDRDCEEFSSRGRNPLGSSWKRRCLLHLFGETRALPARLPGSTYGPAVFPPLCSVLPAPAATAGHKSRRRAAEKYRLKTTTRAKVFMGHG